MKVLLLLATIFVATNADISEILRGQNDLSGRYYQDTTGQYHHDDNSGRYVHVDYPYIHVDSPYVHQDVPHTPYEHVDSPHPPYQHVDSPHPPYEHVHVPHQPYEHVDSPYVHLDVPHSPYEHFDVPHQPYVHEERKYLPPPPAPDSGYNYVKPSKPFGPILPPPAPKIQPYRPVVTSPRPIIVPTPKVQGGGPYRWDLFASGQHSVDNPHYNVDLKLHPHT